MVNSKSPVKNKAFAVKQSKKIAGFGGNNNQFHHIRAGEKQLTVR